MIDSWREVRRTISWTLAGNYARELSQAREVVPVLLRVGSPLRFALALRLNLLGFHSRRGPP